MNYNKEDIDRFLDDGIRLKDKIKDDEYKSWIMGALYIIAGQWDINQSMLAKLQMLENKRIFKSKRSKG